MAARGVGMPCGIVARFPETNGANLEAAIEKAKQRFPILDRQVSWINRRPMLVKINPSEMSSATKSSIFDCGCTFWRHRILRRGKETWLVAIWPHAMADGPSMLRFLENIAAIITNQPVLDFQQHRRRHVELQPMTIWLMRFLKDKSRRYLQPSNPGHPPGVAWCGVNRKHWRPFLESSHADRMSATAWLGAATCIALREQKCISNGKVLLNIQVQRNNLERVGGFGFGAGSLLIPVKLDSKCSLPLLARSIFNRLTEMTNQGWNENFERLLGPRPQRHRWFSWLDARGLRGAIVSISWKDYRWEIDGQNKIRDIACFALSPTLHISGHHDRTGVSLSVTSQQSANERQDFLHRLVNHLSEETPDRILTFDGYDVAPVLIGERPKPFIRRRPQVRVTKSSDALNRA